MMHSEAGSSILKILHLEDSAMDSELISQYLKKHLDLEFQIDIVSNEKEFVSAISTKPYHLILSDFMLPDIDGFQVLKYLHSFSKDIPVIILSGFIGEETAAELLKQGASDYVSKESLSRLDHSIKRALKEYGDQKKLEEAQQSLIRSEEKYRLLYTAMSQGLALHEIVTDERGKPVDYVFLDINESYTHLLGVTREMCIGKRITEVMPEVEQYWIDVFGRVALTAEPMYYENYLKTTDRFYATYSYSPKERQFAVLVSDITERKKNEEMLRHLSYHDQLTELYNRRFFEEELKRLDTPRNLPLSIIMADINGLKLINDSFGHTIGDEYLVSLAKILKCACRADEIIARLGGDEFGIVLSRTDAAEATMIINRLKDQISQTKVAGILLSVSFGCETKENADQPISETIASAENHMYTHKIVERASMRSKTVEMIMSALFEKSDREAQHSQRVSELCEEIAVRMQFDHDDVEQIRMAGLVHDIGKIGINEAILNKGANLDDNEWVSMKRHPESGWRILNTKVEFSEVAQFALCHHERFDGNGYPKGLKGDEIPIQSRIIAVADAFDAMTSERSYRKPLRFDVAIQELRKCSGRQFDPKIVDIFIDIVSKFDPQKPACKDTDQIEEQFSKE